MSKLNNSLKKEIEATFNPNNLELYAEWTWSVEDAFDRCPENPNRQLIRIEWQTIARDLMTDKYLSRPYGAGFNHSRLRFFTTIECDVVHDSIGLEQNLDITLDFSSLKSSRIQFCNV